MTAGEYQPGDVVSETPRAGSFLPPSRRVYLRTDKRGIVYTREEIYRECCLCSHAEWATLIGDTGWRITYIGFKVQVEFCPDCEPLREEMEKTLRLVVEREVADLLSMFRRRFKRGK